MDITATQWRKYGHDRTYLSIEDDVRIGWVDNKTNILTIEVEEHRNACEAWQEANKSEQSLVDQSPLEDTKAIATPEGQAVAPEVENPVEETKVLEDTSSETLDEEWTDLALNRPGQSAREQAEIHLATDREKSKFWTGVARVLDVKTEERAWRVGANGEETVGGRLDKLKADGWFVLHALPIGHKGSDIDHLLIGPGGVWTINTKNHPGKTIWVSPRQIRVDGHVVPYLRNSEFEAERVRKILLEKLGWEPFVKASIVILTGGLLPNITIKQMPEKVVILDRMDIPAYFRRKTGALTPQGIEEVYNLARKSTTWIY